MAQPAWQMEKRNGHLSPSKYDSGWNPQSFPKGTCPEEVPQAMPGARTWEESSEPVSGGAGWAGPVRGGLVLGRGLPGLGLHAGLSVQAAAGFSQEVRRCLQQGKNQPQPFSGAASSPSPFSAPRKASARRSHGVPQGLVSRQRRGGCRRAAEMAGWQGALPSQDDHPL